MLSELLLASAIQIGPFWQHDEKGSAALRPLWSTTAETTDVLWPVFTAHRDWWRCCFVAHYMTNDAGWQFSLLPLWWNGTAKRRGVEGAEPEPYWGLFPIWGTHPHFLASTGGMTAAGASGQSTASATSASPTTATSSGPSSPGPTTAPTATPPAPAHPGCSGRSSATSSASAKTSGW